MGLSVEGGAAIVMNIEHHKSTSETTEFESL